MKKVKSIAPKDSEAPAKKRKGSYQSPRSRISILIRPFVATEDAAPVKPKKSKAPAEEKASKKIAGKAIEKEGGDPVAPAATKKASTTSKKSNGVVKVKEPEVEAPAPKVLKGKRASKKADSKAAEKSEPEPSEYDDEDKEDNEIVLDEESDSEPLENDQTLALIKGFEGDSDDEDAAKNDEGFEPGQEIPKLPSGALTMTKKQQKKLKKLTESGAAEESGVVYIGRIPHGFFEHEMQAYFKQFGNILKLRLSRNKKTGASKHYAFIEFESATVAEIVAKTMDNYLLFGHILKVKPVPAAQVHEDMFKGANKRFKKVPWNKIEGRKLEQAASEKTWDQRVEREEQRREDKADKMKSIGYEFAVPKVKTTKQISRKENAPLKSTGEKEVEEPKPIEETPAGEDTSKPAKKGKKAKSVAKEAKSSINADQAEPKETEASEEIESAPAVKESAKPKKGKKSKAIETTAEEVEPVVTAKAGKPKDNKKKIAETVEAFTGESIAAAPEKKLKKKSKAALVPEPEPTTEEVIDDKAKKAKKSKK